MCYEQKKGKKLCKICEEKTCKEGHKKKTVFTNDYKYCPYCGHNLVQMELKKAIFG